MSVAIRKDRWSATEDEVLLSAVMKYGTNQWNRVASLLSRKSAKQCKSRWEDRLNPRISQREWTPAEDKRLLELAEQMPNLWRSIGTALVNRTGQDSYDRWQLLKNTEPAGLGSDSAESSGSDMDSDAEKQLVAEARARLSNSLGRKAKRKKRERLEDEAKFKESLQQHREHGTRIAGPKSVLSVPEVEHPGLVDAVPAPTDRETLRSRPITGPSAGPSIVSSAGSRAPASTNQSQGTKSETAGRSGPIYQPRKPKRPKLVLPPAAKAPEQRPVPEDLRQYVVALLEKMPPPKGRRLADLVADK